MAIFRLTKSFLEDEICKKIQIEKYSTFKAKILLNNSLWLKKIMFSILR